MGFWWSRRKHLLTKAEVESILDFVRTSERTFAQLKEDLDDLRAKHERLRGRFYATRGPADDEVAPKLTKAQILARHFRPGMPPQHTKE